MPQQNESKHRRGFGVFLGALRDSRGEKQQAFAVEVGVGRSTLAMVENGKRQPSNDLLIGLEKVFPDKKQEIRDEAKRHRKTPLSPMDAEWLGIQRGIDAQIASGETQVAYDAVTSLLIGGDRWKRRRQRFWLHMRHWELATLENRPIPLRATAVQALSLAKDLRLSGSQRVPLHDRVACAALMNGELELANTIVNAGLADFPNAAQLWYRKGVLEWTLGDLAAAYSLLSSALKHKPVSRPDIRGLRGRVLTEWRQYTEAYKDLTAALADPENPPAESVSTRGALLWNKCILGEISLSTAFTEFGQLEQCTPENAWLAYYRALCNICHGDEAEGFRELEERALVYDKPAIYQWTAETVKRDLSERRLTKLLNIVNAKLAKGDISFYN